MPNIHARLFRFYCRQHQWAIRQVDWTVGGAGVKVAQHRRKHRDTHTAGQRDGREEKCTDTPSHAVGASHHPQQSTGIRISKREKERKKNGIIVSPSGGWSGGGSLSFLMKHKRSVAPAPRRRRRRLRAFWILSIPKVRESSSSFRIHMSISLSPSFNAPVADRWITITSSSITSVRAVVVV